ncbi:MAG TPA: tetratricopeptide repeat protein [Candidatus Binatia bacterium]|nr:tetratricopeptide repeat protein [Candidatus Binatia bacterium]
MATLLALITMAVYLPVRGHPFCTMDDEQYVVNNPHLQRGLGWELVRWAFTSYDLANWHPVTWLSHAVDLQLFQLNPSAHHLMNLLLHVANALLLFWVLLRATARPAHANAAADGGSYAGRCFMVAALFALHPINVETVAWIAERKSVLSMAFFLLALGAWGWYARRPRAGRYAVVLLLYALGLLAKPQVITFPFVLLLWDYWPLRRMFATGERTSAMFPPRRFSWLLLEKVPLLALSAGSALMTMKAQGAAGALRYYPLPVRLGNAAVSYVRYMGKAFWPWRLAVFYPHPRLSSVQVLGALLLLLAISGVVLTRRRQPYLLVGWFWYLGTLVPMIGIVQVGEQAMADRYAYVSFIGLFLMVCWGIAEWGERRRLSGTRLAFVGAAVLLALGTLTWRQLGYWSSNVTLWSHTLELTGGSYEAEENLGAALLESGEREEAMQHFARVAALDEQSSGTVGRELAGYAAVAHLYLGAWNQQHGEPAEAVRHYQRVVALAEQFTAGNVYAKVPPVLIRMKAAALGNMGDAYYVLNDLPEAKTSFEAALQLDPNDARRWIGLGVVAQKLGDLPEAVEAYSRATRLQVSDVGFLLLAQALERMGKKQEAQAARERAKLVTPDLAAAQAAVDRLLAQ